MVKQVVEWVKANRRDVITVGIAVLGALLMAAVFVTAVKHFFFHA